MSPGLSLLEPSVRSCVRRRLARQAVLALVGTAVAAVTTGGTSAAVGGWSPQAWSLASEAAACGARPYSYAGVQDVNRGFGVRAAVTALTAPEVRSGHVAAWVGVGGVGEGPSGTSEWIQAGLSAFPAGVMSLYYEVALPGRPPAYTQLESHVTIGRAYSLAVLEIGDRPGWWRVWVDGRPFSPPLHLVSSHGRWAPIATGESWSGGSRVCNAFRFRFAAVSIAKRPGGSWRAVRDHFVFSDAGYGLLATSRAGFLAIRSAASPSLRRLVRVGG